MGAWIETFSFASSSMISSRTLTWVRGLKRYSPLLILAISRRTLTWVRGLKRLFIALVYINFSRTLTWVRGLKHRYALEA